jgi:hypothetical protein
VGGFYTTIQFYTTTHLEKNVRRLLPRFAPMPRGQSFLGANRFPDHPQLSFDTLIPHFGFSVLYPRGILGTSHAKVPVVLS